MSLSLQEAVVLPNAKPEIVRRTANYHPSIWGDRFINCDSEDSILDSYSYSYTIYIFLLYVHICMLQITHARRQQQVEELKAVVKRDVFENQATDFSKKLKLIDAIQRLGVAYHFETEIEEALEHIYAKFHDYDGDLYSVSLGFRLLRQHGYNVSCDIFNKFKDANGSFKECLIDDVSGILSFYEAAHLRVRGEDILDEAVTFTTTNLEAATTGVSHPLAAQVTQALYRPLRKDLERVCARRYMSIYQNEASHNEALLKLAMLDFNLVQSLHKKELSEISRWWKELDFARNLSFARDRMVEQYFWMVGVYFEPHYSSARKILTKVMALASVMDDIYDAYATFEELEIFTAAIERWDVKCLEDLPDYMRVFYSALLNVFGEIEEKMVKEGRSYGVYYVKESFKGVARAYFEEAKWFKDKRIPTVEEYLRSAIISIGYSMLTTVSLVGMGDIVTEETFQWLFNNPKIVIASATLFRLMDDIVTSKFEKERGHVASSIDCYMKQHGVSEEEVIEVFNKQIVDYWKDINEEFLRPTAVPMPVLLRVLNFTKVADLLYKGEDGYTRVGKLMKECVASHFIDPVPL